MLSACGGGGGTPNPGGSGSVTSYQVSATAGTGGTITPASAMVNAGGTTTLWVAGSNTVDATGVYGTQGVAAATNVPGARA